MLQMTTLITIYVICHNHSVWILSLQNYNFSSTFTYLRYLFSLKSVKTVPICTEIHQKALPLPANSLTMEQIFGINSIDIKGLREFCGREGKMVEYRKGEQLEREGDPARWFGFVTEGCFKYVTHGISDDKEHITWFSFEGEFAGDYPACLDGGPALTTIEAMVPTRIIRVSGEQLVKRFSQDKKSMDLRCLIAEHLLSQARVRYTDLHRATPLERYELLLRRCPGIARHLPLNAIASFLCVTPQQLSRIRKAVTFSEK